MGETNQSRATILRRIWASAWFRGFAIAIVAGLVTHFGFPYFDEIVATPAVEITSPVDGEEVQWTPIGHLVTGTCRKVGGDLHLYIAVHPLSTDKWYVQRMPTIINGNWQAVAFFGGEEVGLGDQYELCAFISSKTLHEGQIIELKDFPDHVAKAIVTVSRLATRDQK
jgi:hypothetical protein